MSFPPFKVHFSQVAAAACRLQMNEAALALGDQWQDGQEAEQRNCLVSCPGGARLAAAVSRLQCHVIAELGADPHYTDR